MKLSNAPGSTKTAASRPANGPWHITANCEQLQERQSLPNWLLDIAPDVQVFLEAGLVALQRWLLPPSRLLGNTMPTMKVAAEGQVAQAQPCIQMCNSKQ
jgi:hypothetical protein